MYLDALLPECKKWRLIVNSVKDVRPTASGRVVPAGLSWGESLFLVLQQSLGDGC